MNLTTESQLADKFGLTEEKVAELRRKRRWPHVRLSRFDVRYTDAQVEQIVAMHSEAPKGKAGGVRGGIPGQTARSAARSA